MSNPQTPATQHRAPALKPIALRRADLERASYLAVVPNETTFEDVMRPSFWQHHVAALGGGPNGRPFARVEVVREDGTMDLDLRVLQAKTGMVRMLCLRKHLDDSALAARPAKDAADAEDRKLELPDGYKWAHVPNGQNRGHMIRLAETGEVLAQGLPSKAAAVAVAMRHKAEADSIPA
jgi:hypothetical protein